MGSGLDVDPSRCRVQQAYNIFLHGRLEGGNLGAFQNQSHINVSNLVSVSLHDLVGVFHEFAAVASLPSWIRVLKDLSDVGERQGTKNGIDDRVVNDISVRVGNDAQLRFVDSTLFDVLALGVGPLIKI